MYALDLDLPGKTSSVKVVVAGVLAASSGMLIFRLFLFQDLSPMVVVFMYSPKKTTTIPDTIERTYNPT